MFRSDSRIGEREAPDGEEEETTSQTTPSNQNAGFVRIPQWINQSPVTSLTVLFKDRALLQLQELGSEVTDLIFPKTTRTFISTKN